MVDYNQLADEIVKAVVEEIKAMDGVGVEFESLLYEDQQDFENFIYDRVSYILEKNGVR